MESGPPLQETINVLSFNTFDKYSFYFEFLQSNQEKEYENNDCISCYMSPLKNFMF